MYFFRQQREEQSRCSKKMHTVLQKKSFEAVGSTVNGHIFEIWLNKPPNTK